MLSSLIIQAFFFLIALIIQIELFSRFHFDFLRHGKDIKVSPYIVGLLSGIAVGGAGFVTYTFLTARSHSILEYFYLLFFTLNWFITICFLIQVNRLYHRFLISISVALILTALMLQLQSNLLQSIYIAGSLLWVGPMIFQRFKIQSGYFILFLLSFSILDIVNVYVINPGVTSTGQGLITSTPVSVIGGYVTFGTFMIGMGDFVLSFVAVSWIKRYKGISAAFFCRCSYRRTACSHSAH